MRVSAARHVEASEGNAGCAGSANTACVSAAGSKDFCEG